MGNRERSKRRGRNRPAQSTAEPAVAVGFPWRRRTWIACGALALCGAALVVWAIDPAGSGVEELRYSVINVIPHDPQAYSQGLVVDDGVLYEGTGQYGKSSLRRLDPRDGRVLQIQRLDRQLFGEGITVWGDRIFQLTWREHIGLIYDKQTFEEVGRFRFSGEGWGLTHDGQHLIMSDGTSTLRFLDPQSHQVVRRLSVRSDRQRIRRLNELEFIEGQIFANVWYEDHILRISPATGEVTGWLDLSELYPKLQRGNREHVLNGIAYDAQTGHVFVTGKNWPRMFELRLEP